MLQPVKYFVKYYVYTHLYFK